MIYNNRTAIDYSVEVIEYKFRSLVNNIEYTLSAEEFNKQYYPQINNGWLNGIIDCVRRAKLTQDERLRGVLTNELCDDIMDMAKMIQTQPEFCTAQDVSRFLHHSNDCIQCGVSGEKLNINGVCWNCQSLYITSKVESGCGTLSMENAECSGEDKDELRNVIIRQMEEKIRMLENPSNPEAMKYTQELRTKCLEFSLRLYGTTHGYEQAWGNEKDTEEVLFTADKFVTFIVNGTTK